MSEAAREINACVWHAWQLKGPDMAERRRQITRVVEGYMEQTHKAIGEGSGGAQNSANYLNRRGLRSINKRAEGVARLLPDRRVLQLRFETGGRGGR